MSTRSPLPALTAVTAALGVAEFASTVVIWVEGYPDSQPAVGVVLGLLFTAAALLLRRNRIVPGAVLAGALLLLEVVAYPALTRRNSFDWIFQTTGAVLSLIGVVLAVAALVAHRRQSPASHRTLS
jgi:hypothetical protein